MCSRCQERRDVCKEAVQSKDVKQIADAAKFVFRTMAEDAARALNIRMNNPKG